LKGWWLAGLSVSIVICSSSLYDRYMASTTLYNSSLFLSVVWLFFLPRLVFHPPSPSDLKMVPIHFQTPFFYSKRWLCSLTIKQVPVLFNEAIHAVYRARYIIQAHTHTEMCVTHWTVNEGVKRSRPPGQ
jgi:hypothetical protein